MNPPNTPPDRRVRSMTSSVGTTHDEVYQEEVNTMKLTAC